MQKVPMTAGGFAKLNEELRWRQQEERPRIIEAISEARSHGDLSENAEYHAAKEQQSLNEGRVDELADFIARAEVIDVAKLTGKKKVTKSLTLNNLETFVMLIPPTGQASVIGGAELLVSGKAL